MKKRKLLLLAMTLGRLWESWRRTSRCCAVRVTACLIGSMEQVTDNAGEACAVIRFWVKDNDFEVEPKSWAT